MADIVRVDKTRKALLVTLGVMLLRLPVAWGIQLLLPGSADDPALFYAGLIVQEAALWGLPALLMRPWRTRRLTLLRPGLGLCVAAVFIGFAAQGALMALTPRWVMLTGARQAAVPMPQNSIQWVLAVLALVVIPAVAEECFFRGGVLTGLCDSMSALSATALCTVIFALMHGSLAGFPAHMGISLLCSLAMMARGRLRVPILLHMGYNGAALLLRSTAVTDETALALTLLLAAALLWLLAQVLWRRRTRPLGLADSLLLAAVLLGAAALYVPEFL